METSIRKRVSTDELKRAASGRWLEVLGSAGLPADLLNGRGHPCPRCGGRDRFAAWPDVNARGVVHCRHCFTAGTDPAPSDGIATIQWSLGCTFPEACQWLAGWLGIAADANHTPRIIRTVSVVDDVPTDEKFVRMAAGCHDAMRPHWWDSISESLNLPIEPLRRLRVGWSATDNASTWPMVNSAGDVIGIRLRSMSTGDKWSVKGGRAGLFVPVGIGEAPPRLFIAEGPTDAAALLSLGFVAVGRPSSSGAVEITAGYVCRLHPAEVVILADNDEHDAGIIGARSLAASLMKVCPAVRLMIPPDGINDARDWVANGATADDINQAADNAELRTLSIVSGVQA